MPSKNYCMCMRCEGDLSNDFIEYSLNKYRDEHRKSGLLKANYDGLLDRTFSSSAARKCAQLASIIIDFFVMI